MSSPFISQSGHPIQQQPPPSAPPDFNQYTKYQPPPIQQQPGFSSPPGYSSPPKGYPPPQGYPPQQGYPPSQGYPPQLEYPTHQGYHPSQPGYPPPQGYPTPQPGYPPQTGYPPPQSGFYPPPGPPEYQLPGQPPGQYPGGLNNMPAASGPAGPTLGFLTSLDTLLVKQSTDILQVFTGVRFDNHYKIKIPYEGEGKNHGQDILHAFEESGWLSRICLGRLRSFEMKIYDLYQNEVIRLIRPFGCGPECCIPNCTQEMIVESPPGHFIGKIEQPVTCCGVEFNVLDHNHQPQLVVKAPSCFCRQSYLCGDVKFRIFRYDSEIKIGRISKQWGGLMRETFTDSDFFGVSFPKDLDVRLKATLLGACFLIDSLFFNRSGNDHN